MSSSRYETRISESRCRRHLRERPASEYERTIVPRSPNVQALPRERQQVAIWSTRKMVRPEAGREEDVHDLPRGR